MCYKSSSFRTLKTKTQKGGQGNEGDVYFSAHSVQVRQNALPSFGYSYLAAVLKARGVQVDLVDGQIIEEGKFWQEINDLTADVVLISATIRQIKSAEMVAKIV